MSGSSSASSSEDYDALDIYDITSDGVNADILRRMKNNDPDFTQLLVFHKGGWRDYHEYSHIEYSVEDARGMGALGYYVSRCTNLTELTIILVREEWDVAVIEPFFLGLQNNRSIRTMNFTSESYCPCALSRMLMPFIKGNRNLATFDVCESEMDVEQYRSFSLALREGRSLKDLFTIGRPVDGGRYDHEESIIESIDALKMHRQLERIAFYDFAMGRNACEAFSGLLKQSAGGIKMLNLLRNGIDDAGVEALVDGLAHCRGLQELNLSGNPAITIRGLRALAALLEDPNSSLQELDLSKCGIKDDGAIIVANALANNSMLETLHLDSDEDISSEGWDAFFNVLCDTSSVNSTFLSNHTLWILALGDRDRDDVATLQGLNEENDKKKVAIRKILLHHDDFDMQPLFEWDLKMLPLVVEWFERVVAYRIEHEADTRERKLAAIYQFIRGQVPTI